MSESVFICYRREDSAAEATQLWNALQEQLEPKAVFFDRESVGLGTKFPERIQGALSSAKVVLVVIGPDWLREGSDMWGQRRIDQPSDWVRTEIAFALKRNKVVIPVFVRGQKTMPPKHVLPAQIQDFCECHGVAIDKFPIPSDTVSSLLAGVSRDARSNEVPSRAAAMPQDRDSIQAALKGDLHQWRYKASNEGQGKELSRELRFSSFQDVMRFMEEIAPECELMEHHPRWQNRWRELAIHLTTWKLGNKISDRDLRLARFIESSYEAFLKR
jgi:pterin-4a-carbinolamine dehydratase